MTRGAYHVISETTEDRFDETDDLDEAIRIARRLAEEGQGDDPVSIEHNGSVIHQFVRTTSGVVDQSPSRGQIPRAEPSVTPDRGRV